MSDVTTVLPNPLLPEFWVRPMPEIDADLASLQAAGGVTFHEEPEVPPEIPLPQGPGGWVLTRHADILHVSKNPQIFSSADGITIGDVPPEFLEFFSSMIAMDDPRHARLRRIVSAGFTPRMLKQARGLGPGAGGRHRRRHRPAGIGRLRGRRGRRPAAEDRL